MCNHKTLKNNNEILNLPYFEEVLSTTIFCEQCNYKFSDILITSQKQPMEHKFTLRSEKDLNVRVIRSTTATIELPELDIKIEPATASEAFISNIEGVLVRVASAVEQVGNFSTEPDKKEQSKKIIKKIEQLRKGIGSITVIIRDPMGNSGIISDRTEKRELTVDEINALQTGMIIIDLKANQDIIQK